MDIKFVNVSIDNSLEVVLEGDMIHPDDTTEYLLSLVEDGYKVSASYHAKNSSYIVSVTGKSGTPNDGKCLSFWGSSVSRCIQFVHLAHTVLATNHDWESVTENGKQIIRDLLTNR